MNRGQKLWVTVTIWIVVIGFAGGGVLFFTPGGPQGLFRNQQQQQEEPAIVVNGEEIPTTELETRTQQVVQRQRRLAQQFGMNFEERLQGASGSEFELRLRDQAAQGLIRETLVTQKANERGVSVPQTEVDEQFRQQFQQVLSQSPFGSEEQLRNALEQSQRLQQTFRQRFGGATVEAFKNFLRARVREQLKREQLQDEVVGEIEPSTEELLSFVDNNRQRFRSQIVGPIEPSTSDLRGYFQEHTDQYSQTEAHVRQILIKPSSDGQQARQSATQTAQELYQQLQQEGTNFAELARQHSDGANASEGGNLGWITRNASPHGPTFADRVFRLEPGGITEPFGTDAGIHIAKLVDRRVQQPAFSDVRDQVQQDYIQAQRDARFQEWLTKARENGSIPKTKEVKARHILIEVGQDASSEQIQSAERQIQQLHQRLQNGADFAELARQHSDDPSASKGGDLGWITRGEMVPQFTEVAFNLESGSISEPFRTRHGFHIVKVDDTRMSDALASQIRDAYKQQERTERFDKWVQKQKDQAEIEIQEDLLRAYRLTTDAEEAKAPERKIELLDQAIDAYGDASTSVGGNPHVGYLQSQAYLQKLEVLQGQLDKLDENAKEKRSSLKERIDETKQQAVNAFLRSVGNYAASDDSEFQALVSQAPNHAELRYYYARFLYNTVEAPDRALQQIEEALAIRSDYRQAHELAAEIHRSQGNYDQALQHLATASEAVDSGSSAWRDLQITQAQIHLDKATRASAEGSSPSSTSLQEANRILTNLRESLSESNERYGEVMTLLGELHTLQGEHEQAAQAYNAALEAGTSQPLETEVKLGEAQLAAGSLDAAETTFDSIINRQAGQYSVGAHVGLGDVYRAQGRPDEAMEAYKQAMELQAPRSTKIEIAEKILELNPNETKVRSRLASLYLEANQPKQAKKQFETILEENPKNWQAQRGLGKAYLALEQPEQASEHLKSALLQDPPARGQITIYESLLEAQRALAGDGELSKDGKDALLQLAQLYTEQGRLQQAQQRIQTLKQQYPEFRSERVAEIESNLQQARQQQQGSATPGAQSPTGTQGTQQGP